MRQNGKREKAKNMKEEDDINEKEKEIRKGNKRKWKENE
jgi:hypothetical protein